MLLEKIALPASNRFSPKGATGPIPTGQVPYYQFPELSRHEALVHAVFTRRGGVSAPPFESLNTGFATGDSPESVSINLKIIQEIIGARDLRYLDQVHGRDILVLRDGEAAPHPAQRCGDAIITDRRDLALMVKQADCQGIILFDTRKNVLSTVHCGWRGSRLNILGAVVRRMQCDFGCRPSDLLAAVGPSLGPCCGEFKTHEEILPAEFREFMVRRDYFDFWEISRRQLLRAGLEAGHIHLARICTRCRSDLFYSYRAEGVTGRFATVAMLKPRPKDPGPPSPPGP